MAAYVSKAIGKGGSFVRFEDPAPKGKQLVAIDGFEISGYSQAIYREFYESQLFDITNNYIHDNVCKDQTLVGAGFALNNVSGTIRGNVIEKNSCGRGGAGFLNDSKNENSVLIESNFIDANSGTEPDGSHGGALYLFGNKLKIVDNIFTNNTVTQWGGGLYIGAFKPGGQLTTATLSRNVYRGNRAGNKGGGFFCDDGASCTSDHEFFEKNCGDNVLLDSGPKGSGPTVAKFDFMTNADALTVDCSEPGIGVRMDRDDSGAADTYTFTNSTFRGNAKGGDLGTGCNSGCAPVKVTVTNSKVQREYVNGGIDIKFDAASGPALELPSSPASPSAAPASKLDAEIAKSPARPASKEAYGPPEAADDGGAVEIGSTKPAVTRGAKYMGFAEQFNRYYTDAGWKPAKTVYVSPDGSGDGANRTAPMPVAAAISEARAGTKIHFLPGKYEGCFEFGKENSGTFDAPVVLYAERAGDQSTGVAMTCCKSGRKSCFNLEQADYIAVDGFEFIGGQYGVRAVGAGFPASEHSRGIAVLGCVGHDQDKDPFFSGQSDWNVWERNLAYGAKKGDGHGIYLSNGSDWNIVRLNSTYGNEFERLPDQRRSGLDVPGSRHSLRRSALRRLRGRGRRWPGRKRLLPRRGQLFPPQPRPWSKFY